MESSIDLDFTDVGSSAGCTKIPSTHIPSSCTFGYNKIDQGWRTKPIPYSIRLASEITQEIACMMNSSSPEEYICSPRIKIQCGNEVKRFGMAIQGYLKSRKPLIPLKVLLDGIKTHNFADVLKKTRIATLTRKVKAESNIDDGLDNFVLPNFHLLEDIGQVFHYKYWLRWEEPDPEAWKFGLLELKEVSDDFKAEFRDALRKVLPDSVSPVHANEVLASLSSSSCRTSSGRPTKVFREKMNDAENVMSRSFLKGYRSTVYKAPTETRDCLILPICKSNTIKWIEKQMAEVAKKTLYSAYGKSDEVFNRTLEDFYDRDSHYYNRDITKEGITKPRWILTEIGKVCKELYPNCPVWDYFSIYDKYELIVDGVTFAMPRGTGLGMANALTTIMQCGFFQMLIDRNPELPDADALFYNDDATIKMTDALDVLTYTGIEADLFEEAGLILKESKTYASPVMILCEKYYPKEYSNKDSYCKYIHRIPFAATNILVAKTQFYLCDDPVFGSLEPHLLPMALRFFGHEWSNEEYSLPTFMGGWLAPVYKGVRLDFIEDIPLTQVAMRGLTVGQPSLKPKKFWKDEGLFIHPIMRLTGLKINNVDHSVWDLYDLVRPMSEVAAKFHRSLDDDMMYQFLQQELLRRYMKWSTPSKPLNIAEVYIKVVNDNPLMDFIPPDCLRKEVSLESISRGDKREYPPDQPNKLLGVISFFSGCSYIDKVIPYPYLPGERNGKWDLTPDRLSKYQESIYALPGVTQLCDPTRDYELSTVLLERHYCNDYDVWAAWKATTGLDTFPRPLIRSRGGEIKHTHQKYLRQAEYLGSQAHWDMWTTIGRTIPVIHMSGVLSVKDWEDILQIGEDLEESISTLEGTRTKPDMETSDFGTYFAGHRDGWKPPLHLENIFLEVRDLISRAELWKSVHAQSNRDMPPNVLINQGMPLQGSPRDLVYKRLTGVEGYFYLGLYVYQLPSTNIFDGSDDGSEDGYGGLFDDPGG